MIEREKRRAMCPEYLDRHRYSIGCVGGMADGDALAGQPQVRTV
jgi:hypothetical protein